MSSNFHKFSKNKIAYLLLAILIGAFIFRSYTLFQTHSDNLIKDFPEARSYRSDEFIFLRTFYLIDRGLNYYSAFNQSVLDDSRGGYLTKDVFTWRMPTVFYLWAILANNGSHIGILFIIFSSLSLLCFYLISIKFLNPFLSLLSPFVVMPYFLDAYHYGTSFLFTEWWGLFFFIFGVTVLFYSRKKLAILFFSLALLTRELFIIPVLALALISIYKHKNIKLFVIPAFVFVVFYLIHFSIVKHQNVVEDSRNIFSRVHFFNFTQFQREISFSMRQYPLLNFKLPVLVVIFSTLFSLIKLKTSNFKIEYWYLFLSFFSLLITAPFLGIIFNDYWGVTFMPLALGFLPAALFSRLKG